MSDNLKVFRGSYRDSWPYGGYEDIEVIVVANTEAEALGLILEKAEYKDKVAANWDVTEIDVSALSVIETLWRGN